jgi:hypothetical protein
MGPTKVSMRGGVSPMLRQVEKIGMLHRAKELQDLEDRVVKVLTGANELPPGPERQELLDDIKKFIARLSKLKAANE